MLDIEDYEERGWFADMAAAAGLPHKVAYSTHEVAKATGVSHSAVCRCAAMGNLPSFLPRGMKRGRLITPAMADHWLAGE